MTFRQAMMTSIVLLAWLTFSSAFAANLIGVPRIVDGDTLAIGAMKFRLEGIDAPETDQVCLNANGARWTCGIDARDQLTAHIAGRETQQLGWRAMTGLCGRCTKRHDRLPEEYEPVLTLFL
jgi:endonuclease YncB( thermonuclease family)